ALFTPDGKINWADWRVTGSVNPVSDLVNPSTNSPKDLRIGAGLSYIIIPGLTFNLRGNYNLTTTHQIAIAVSGAGTYPLLTPVRQTGFGDNDFYSLSVEPTLNYVKTFGRHNLQFLVGANYFKNNQTTQTLNASG